MRQVTATEKYKAVNEGQMSKSEFVRQMRLAYPQLISQFNGYDDSVQILRNRGMIFENTLNEKKEEKAKIYDERPTNTYSFEALKRGIRAELEAKGITVEGGKIEADDYYAAEAKAKANLEKNPNHYLELMSGESAKVDKHDKEVEYKKGKEVDTFNGMKKAELKESVEESQATLKEQIADVIEYLKANKGADNATIKDFIKTHFEDIRGMSLDQIGDEFDEFLSVNYELPGDYNDLAEESEGSYDYSSRLRQPEKSERGGLSRSETEEAAEKLAAAFTEEDQDGLIYRVNSDLAPDSFDLDIDDKEGIDPRYTGQYAGGSYYIADHNGVKEIRNAATGGFLAAYIEDGEFKMVPASAYSTNEEVNERVGGIQEFVDLIEDRAANNDTMPQDEAVEVIEAIAEEYDIPMEFGRFMNEEPNEGNKFEAERLKAIKAGKDSFEVDGKSFPVKGDGADDKKRAADINEDQLKSAIKTIIKESLLNEAATVKLADWAEGYEGFPGVKPVVNELENIVTEIESFYDKMSDKIAKVFEKTSGFENEEGLKIGGFIAPSLESAFRQDLSKVIKKGTFFSKINLPKVRTITQADIDAHNSGERPLGEEEKSTVFTPVNENEK